MTGEQYISLLLRGTVHDVTPGPLPMNSVVTSKLSGAEECWRMQHLEMVASKLKHLLLNFSCCLSVPQMGSLTGRSPRSGVGGSIPLETGHWSSLITVSV